MSRRASSVGKKRSPSVRILGQAGSLALEFRICRVNIKDGVLGTRLKAERFRKMSLFNAVALWPAGLRERYREYVEDQFAIAIASLQRRPQRREDSSF